MPTINERKFELKQKRSDALMAKLNVLMARDGSVAPPIDSMADEDLFNLGLLFGYSRNENITWTSMGVEGLIRCYYEIIYKLRGTVRNNIIKEGGNNTSFTSHNSTERSGLRAAANNLTDGQGYKSGFYIGWKTLESEIANTSNTTTKIKLNNVLSRGRKGEFDVPMTKGWTTLASQLGKPNYSTSFTINRDKYQIWYDPPGPTPGSLIWIYPPDERSQSLLGKIDDLLAVIGTESPVGPHIKSVSYGSSPVPYTYYTNNTLLGIRHRDVAPYTYTEPTRTFSFFGSGTDKTNNILINNIVSTDATSLLEINDSPGIINLPNAINTPRTEGFLTHDVDGETVFGNGTWDVNGTQYSYPPGYTPSQDYWTSSYDSAALAIISKINDIITYIDYTKITNFTYFVNYMIIPGIDPNYDPDDVNSNIGFSWNLQNGWINTLTTIKDRIQQSLDFIDVHKNGSSLTNASARNIVDQELISIKAYLLGALTTVTALGAAIDSTSIFGTIDNPLTLYGHRFMWIRSIVDPNEGSKTAVNATGMAIDIMEKKLKKAEEELYMFGITEPKFIPTPIIVGIEAYPVMNQTTFEMEIGGWLVAWGGQTHCNGYDVWKSDDYDPETKQGTWNKLEVSNTNYTMTDIDANTGKVLTYIIDGDVDPIPNDVDPATITHPYYKVKAYDVNAGSGDYDRSDTMSEECEPQNPAAFPFGGDSTAQHSGPRGTAQKAVTTTPTGPSIPPNTLAWVTTFKGGESLDFERRLFESEAPFDSTGSNLMVFVDGEFKNQGLTEDEGDYELLDIYKIRFNLNIAIDSEVNLVVFLRSFAKSGDYGTVSVYGDLPFPPDVENGDIYFVEEPSPGAYYQWVDPPGEWRLVGDPNGSSIWRDPVNSFTQLPTSLNVDGDIRMVLDSSTLYRWVSAQEEWVKISGSTGGSWLPPVDTSDDLLEIESNTLSNGTVVFIISEESFYRWSSTQNEWIRVTSASSSSYLRDLVNNVTDLPMSNNGEGDLRLVLNENKLYRWFAWDREWKPIIADVDLIHEELRDEDWEIVDDHDARYYPKSELDEYHGTMEERLNLLESLKPKDAQPLSGNFAITGTKIYSGYLSEGRSILRYNTLAAGDYFNKIIKDTSFILSNNDVTQFKDADKGILYCYINGEQVDEFNLAEWFNEDERINGQTYPRQFGLNNIIEILSVGPYNQYPIYQRADFQLNIKSRLLLQGENNIKLVHEIGNSAGDINSTEDFTVFWDEFDGYMGFKEIYIDEMELNSNKYLSGVRYYSMGDKLRFRFKVENLFNNTFVKDEQIFLNLDEFGITPFYINYEDINILGVPVTRIGEDIYYMNTLELELSGVYSSQPNLKLEAKNPFGVQQHSKTNTQILINTVDVKSTPLTEQFVDEYYRLLHGDYNSITAYTGQWNSEQQLTPDDLQVFGGRLIYPNQNFTNYFPSQTVNYENCSGPKYYYRVFHHANPHSNGKLIIQNFYNADSNIKAEIKLPGLTGWLDLATLYNEADFTGANGDGCLIHNKGESYEWTSGIFNTANSSYLIILKITLFADTNYIEGIRMEDW